MQMKIRYWETLTSALQDVRIGLRILHRQPGFAAAAVITLSLGIGATTAIFSALDATLFRSLPYPDSDRLVMLWGRTPSLGSHRGQVSFTDSADWRAQNTSFEDVLALVLMRFLQGLLLAVTPYDGGNLQLVGGILTLVATAAYLFPVCWAAGVDPRVALTYE